MALIVGILLGATLLVSVVMGMAGRTPPVGPYLLGGTGVWLWLLTDSLWDTVGLVGVAVVLALVYGRSSLMRRGRAS